MILSNVEIHAALDSGRLIIDPEPLPRAPMVGQDCPYDTHSVDLRLGVEISIPKGGIFAYDHTQPGKLSDLLTQSAEKRVLMADQPFRLEKGIFVLGVTQERVALPIDPKKRSCLAARIEGKS